MSLTPAQKATLKNDILTDPVLSTIPNTPDGTFEIARLYNLTVAPDFWVWRSSVTKGEYVNETSVDGTTFNWTGAGFITRLQGERDAWSQMFMNSLQAVNPSLPQVRAAFQDIFSGAIAPAPANRTHLATISRRLATKVEKLFAVGTGSTASPANMVIESPISPFDVQEARDS